jgi:hypothetical protein
MRRDRTRHSLLSAALILALAVPVALALLSTGAPSAAAAPESEWWNTAWTRRRPITIMNEHPENYQIKITLPYDADMRTDYGDIRFLENEAVQELSYWVESYTTTEAIVWVKRIVANDGTDNVIWLYYGNPSAMTTENGDTTFELFDHFLGTSLDASKWIGTTGSEGQMVVGDGLLKLQGNYSKSTYSRIISVNTFSLPMQTKFRWGLPETIGGFGQQTSRHRIGLREGTNGDNYIWVDQSESAGWNWRFQTSKSGLVTSTSVNKSYGSFIEKISWIAENATYRDDETTIASHAENVPSVALNWYALAASHPNTATRYELWVDWIFVANYISPEPTATVRSEQGIPNPPSDLKAQGLTNPTRLTIFTPLLDALYTIQTGENAENMWIQVSTDNTFTTITHWDTGWVDTPTTENNTRQGIIYAGSALSRGTTYYWRAKWLSQYGVESAWSAVNYFRLNRLPSQTYASPSGTTIAPIPSLTITWNFNDPDGDNQLGVKIQISTDPTFTTITHWDYSDMTTTAQSMLYEGVTLQRDIQYFIRVQVRDNSGEWSGTWATENFILKGVPYIASINTSNTLIDREINQADSGAVDSTVIYITARDNWGRSWIENAYIWIRDNTDTVVVDNLQLTSYENIDENTKRFVYNYNPDDSLTALGAFDVKAQVIGVDAAENTKGYMDLGYQLFEVNDLIVSLNLRDNTPIYQLSAFGTIARIYGTASADNVVVEDNNEGIFIANFTDNSYSKNYGLVSPVRLHHGDQGHLNVWTRDDTLDGISPTLTYEVQGDNAILLITTVNNQVGQSVVSISATWASDSSNVSSGTAYFETESLQATISNGAGQFTLDHSTWIPFGARVISLYDNADRPLWNVTKSMLITKSLLWAENRALSSTQDNASLRVKITYNDASTNNTIKAELIAGTVDKGQVTADENGLLAWSGIDLPDNTQNIQLRLDNVYDSRTDWVINARDVEDAVIYTENTTCSFTFTDNDQTIEYGSSATLSGTLTSQASYVILTIRENLHYRDNNGNIENKFKILSPGASDTWSFTLFPTKTDYYTVKMLLVPDNTLMWVENARITVKLSTPTIVSPSNGSATIDNTPVLQWQNVNGVSSYTVQTSTYENFDNVDGTTKEYNTSENSLTLTELVENVYYWRVKAATTAANVENSDWSSTRNFWVDKTDPSIWSFLINSGASETTSSSVALSISASDSGSGVYQMCFKNEDGSWSAWELYSTSKSWMLSPGDGSKTVYVRVRDRALNESPVLSDGIIKTTYVPPEKEETPPADTIPPTPPADTTPPTLTVLEPTATEVSENVTVRVSASDPFGIDPGSILMTLDGTTVQHAYSGGEIMRSFVGLSAGGHVVVVEVSDASSNHNQATVNISFTVVAPIENVENIGVENIENVTLAPTFTLQLPATPLEVENGHAQIMLWIINPTPQPILKRCELRFDNHVKPFNLEVAAWENMLLTIWIDVAGMEGTYDLKLYDVDTDRVLDEGEITLFAAAGQPKVPLIPLTSPPPSLLIVAMGVVGAVIGLGVLHVTGRLPRVKMPSLPRLPKIRHKPKPDERLAPEEKEFKTTSKSAGGGVKPPGSLEEEEFELVEESPVVQDIYHLLEPAARELATKKKVGHLDRAVKPYKKRRR